MNVYEVIDGGVLISDDRTRLNHMLIHDYLFHHSYWAREITPEVFALSLEHSLCFGIYLSGQQIGFGRVITDYATFAWLADVFVVEEQRGRGYSKKLLAVMLAHPRLQGLRRFLLATKDAHGLYRQFGFRSLAAAERFMEIRPETSYNIGS